jgi:hypothetical protein
MHKEWKCLVSCWRCYQENASFKKIVLGYAELMDMLFWTNKHDDILDTSTAYCLRYIFRQPRKIASEDT